MTRVDGFDDAADDFAAFAANLREAAARIDAAVDDGVETTALQVERSAKQHAPVDTGTLRSSIGHRRLAVGEHAVGTPVDYAPDVEYGTQPHVITPDSADALRFTAERDVFGLADETIFAAFVQHPGTPAQPFLRPALREHQSDLTRNIAAAIDDLLREVFSP